MDFLLSRYRNLTVLLLAILAQLVLLAYQVKSNQDVRLIRVWAVSAVTPLARLLEFTREHTIGVAEKYFVLVNVRSENERLQHELGRLKMENQFLHTELQTADRAQALQAFQARTPSRTVPARIIGTGTGANSRVVFVDQGSGTGIMRGMAVVTPDGIVGKVLASYPTASQVLLITDPTFAAGVISDKNRIHGTLKGIGQNKCIVDYVQNEEKVEVGEMFYTSGDDRIFPKGMPVGKVSVVRAGKTFKDIYVAPAGFQHGLEEVLIVVEGIHQPIPDVQANPPQGGVYIMAPPEPAKPSPSTPEAQSAGAAGRSGTPPQLTDADRLRERYQKIGEAQGHVFGDGRTNANFNASPDATKSARPSGQPSTGAPTGTTAPGQAPITAPPKPGGQTAPAAPKPSPPATNAAPYGARSTTPSGEPSTGAPTGATAPGRAPVTAPPKPAGQTPPAASQQPQTAAPKMSPPATNPTPDAAKSTRPSGQSGATAPGQAPRTDVPTRTPPVSQQPQTAAPKTSSPATNPTPDAAKSTRPSGQSGATAPGQASRTDVPKETRTPPVSRQPQTAAPKTSSPAEAKPPSTARPNPERPVNPEPTPPQPR